MKPFDLQKALAGEPVCLSDGSLVKIAGFNPNAIEDSKLVFWNHDGIAMRAFESGKVGLIDHLFMAGKKRNEWIVRATYKSISNGEYFFQYHGPFESFEIANRFLTSGDCKNKSIHEITITE